MWLFFFIFAVRGDSFCLCLFTVAENARQQYASAAVVRHHYLTISNTYIMYTKQLSVFLENKSGRLTEVTEILAGAGINLSAMSIADSSDFGILRCVVSDPILASKCLREHGFAVKITDVIGFSTPNVSGSLAVILRKLSEAGAEIEYMYSFNNGQVANVIIRTVNMEACERILSQSGVRMLSDEELYHL